MTEYLIAGLALTNVVQFMFWSWQNQTLVNKLMCKDYAEYNLIKKGPPKVQPIEEDPREEIESQEILRELNSRFSV